MPDVSVVSIPGSCAGKAVDEDWDCDSELEIKVSPQHSLKSGEFANGFVRLVSSILFELSREYRNILYRESKGII